MLQRSKVPLWLTFNEPNAIRGVCMMVIKDQRWQTYWQAIHHMCVAGALAVKMDRELCPGARFSTMFAMSEFYGRLGIAGPDISLSTFRRTLHGPSRFQS